ncbi:hypothetical protein PR003_g22084 [Phytophthora rubi]|uniref:Uncharacterized protein n=1 Tax=Phytophthora rubi TaxID=129364 RepID=A0A6A3HML2_9STRA|nr:hypothetical protein PR002_g27402 [Phytophthora rubi]KAE9303157.1 hypothetical protein PR003_g22084 [Phytophthora rubi]
MRRDSHSRGSLCRACSRFWRRCTRPRGCPGGRTAHLRQGPHAPVAGAEAEANDVVVVVLMLPGHTDTSSAAGASVARAAPLYAHKLKQSSAPDKLQVV